MRTLLLVVTFVLISLAAFFSTDLLAGQLKDDTSRTKKYAADDPTPYKSFAGIVKAAHKKTSATKSRGSQASKSSKIGSQKKKSLKKIAASKNGSSLKALSKKYRSGKSLSAGKKGLSKKLSARKHKLSGKSLKNKSYTRNYSAKSKSLKDRTKSKITDVGKRSAAK